jgi:hypothetical protein
MPLRPPWAEAHEGAWLYVSAPLLHLNGAATEFVERIKRSIEAAGRLPFLSPETPGATSSRASAHEALRFAQACIVDISVDFEQVGIDLGCALATRRPLIALRHDASTTGDLLLAAVTAPGRGRVIRYSSPAECVAQLQTTFMDPDWWRLVADAVAQDVA